MNINSFLKKFENSTYDSAETDIKNEMISYSESGDTAKMIIHFDAEIHSAMDFIYNDDVATFENDIIKKISFDDDIISQVNVSGNLELDFNLEEFNSYLEDLGYYEYEGCEEAVKESKVIIDKVTIDSFKDYTEKGYDESDVEKAKENVERIVRTGTDFKDILLNYLNIQLKNL